MSWRNRPLLASLVGVLALGSALIAPSAQALTPKALATANNGGITATALTIGVQSSCALLKDGQVKCWGRGADGQIGYPTNGDRGDGPRELGDYAGTVSLGTGRTAKAIEAGGWHACALLDNKQLKCWGLNGDGALGLGDTASRGNNGFAGHELGDLLPAVDLGTGAKVKSFAAGDYSTCAIVGNGSVKCWGSNDHGQLGIGDNAGNKTKVGDQAGEMGNNLPAINLGTGRKAKALAGGTYFNCALLDNGSVKCWGANDHGQSGIGDNSGDKANIGDQPNEMGNNLPAINLGTGRKAKSIGAGWQFACALLDNGSVKCWGDNGSGEIGLGDNSGDKANIGDQANEMGNNLPAINLGTGRKAKAIVVGAEHACALLDNKQLKCWGYNADGELGIGDSNNRGDNADEMGDNLAAVDLGTGNQAKSVRSGGGAYHTCALLVNNTVKCWGWNPDGQLGIGDAVNHGDDAGEMGDNLPTVNLGVKVKAVSDYSWHACAIISTGAVACWGLNEMGQLGQGTTVSIGDNVGEVGDALGATNLGTGRTARALSIGSESQHTCALLDNKTTKCWGWNANGQLGLGDTTNRGDSGAEGHDMGDLLPAVDFGTKRTAKAIATGDTFTCALLDNSSVKCWGDNSKGQLGLGDTSGTKAMIGDVPGEMGSNLPAINLGKGRRAKAIAAGSGFACALLDNGSVKCWGLNDYGQLGIGDNSGNNAFIGDQAGEMGNALRAVNLGTRRRAKAIAVGGYHACAVLDDNSMKCWGGNGAGQLGLGNTTNRGDSAAAGHELGNLLPAVSVGTGRKVRSITAGDAFTCALLDNKTLKCWGYAVDGALGNESTTFRGDSADAGHEMGDLLPGVSLGTSRRPITVAAGGANTCALLDDQTVKCWGYNGDGALGLGSTVSRGDSAAVGHRMGDYLPIVAFTG